MMRINPSIIYIRLSDNNYNVNLITGIATNQLSGHEVHMLDFNPTLKENFNKIMSSVLSNLKLIFNGHTKFRIRKPPYAPPHYWGIVESDWNKYQGKEVEFRHFFDKKPATIGWGIRVTNSEWNWPFDSLEPVEMHPVELY